MSTQSQGRKTPNGEPIIIKKYTNRRLYNTDTSCYITLDELAQMVKKQILFVVQDAKTAEDMTRQTLVQIIFEKESKKFSMMPEPFLRQIISYYDHKMQEVLPSYLEAMMESFSQNQERIHEYMGKASPTTGFTKPFSQFEELGKQNMEMMQKAFTMFNPFESMFGVKNTDSKKDK